MLHFNILLTHRICKGLSPVVGMSRIGGSSELVSQADWRVELELFSMKQNGQTGKQGRLS